MAETRRYEFDLNLKDLKDDIVIRLSRLYPDMPLEERAQVADCAIKEVNNQGNSSLYNGLVLYGVQIAKEKCREHHEE